jgi:succinate dehydrogenase / fumarate reductase cytochrome b subunit
MFMAAIKESFFWHKVHSLTGIVPIGFYMLQHLTLNSFSLAGPEQFNKVVGFFESLPKHFLLGLEIVAIWIPLLFHAIYGTVIVMRAQPNLTEKAYKFRENRYYTWQRISGLVVFLFLIYHVLSTTVNAKVNGGEVIHYDGMHTALTQPILGIPYLIFFVYFIGIGAAAYHLAYGIWNFCIRWGITISAKAQMNMAKVASIACVAITLLAWSALVGFIWSPFASSAGSTSVTGTASGPSQQQPVSFSR